MIFWLVMTFIIAQRLIELRIANRNTRELMARGAQEYSPGHYRLIVVFHSFWITTMLLLGLLVPASIQFSPAFLLAFALLTALRFWVLVTLGRNFTTRIVSLAGAPLVRAGPYRWLRHPNYVVVIGEIFCVPMIFGWWQFALLASALHLPLILYRIRCEELALSGRPTATPV